jgi:hypothetical protein
MREEIAVLIISTPFVLFVEKHLQRASMKRLVRVAGNAEERRVSLPAWQR